MRIELELLKRAPLKSFVYEFKEKILDTDWFLTDDFEREDTEIHVKMSAYFSEGIVFLKGSQVVQYDDVCDRCAERFSAKFSGSFSEEVKLSANSLVHNGETGIINAEELSGMYLSPDSDFLELKDFFRQLFLASLKIKSLCSVNCKGLCSECGANKNITDCSCGEDKTDFRLLGLKELKDKLK